MVQSDGAIVRISDKNEGQSWDIKEIVRISNLSYLAGEVRLLVTDLDNNGAFDLVLAPVSPGLAGALVWLGDTNGILTALSHPVGSPLVFAVADVNGDGRLDLLGLSADGLALQAITQASKNYHWQVVRPHAAQAVGDQRINPFGVGGEVEIRSGSWCRSCRFRAHSCTSDWANSLRQKSSAWYGQMERSAPSSE